MLKAPLINSSDLYISGLQDRPDRGLTYILKYVRKSSEVRKKFENGIVLTNVGSITVELVCQTYYMPPKLKSSDFLVSDQY